MNSFTFLKSLRMTRTETSNFLERAVSFIEPYLNLANSHMVHYFTHNYHQTVLDERLRKTLELVSVPKNIPELLIEEKESRSPALDTFLDSIRTNSYLARNNASVFQVHPTQVELINPDMTDKKAHEVSEFCNFLLDEWRTANISAVFDVGCGKGHLGQMLSVVGSWEVLGLDVMKVKEEDTAKRLKRLKGLLRKGKPEIQRDKPTKFFQKSAYISEDTNLSQLAEEMLPDWGHRANGEFGVVGLHTCGNLASVSLKLFARNAATRYIVNVGCCYHLLEEEFSANPFETGPIVPQDRERDELNDQLSQFTGFPLSGFLRGKKYTLGRNARMMASQSVHRLAEEECPDNIFHRAVLEVIICDKLDISDFEGDPHSHFTVGRIRKSTEFFDYVTKATKKIPGVMITESECHEYLQKFSPLKSDLLKFYYVRNCLAPVIETIILLDRLLFLQEDHLIKSARLIRLFDPLTSPRCVAIVAEK